MATTGGKPGPAKGLAKGSSVPIRVLVARAGSKETCPAGWCRTKPKELVCLGCHQRRKDLFGCLVRDRPDVLILDATAQTAARLDWIPVLKTLFPDLGVLVTADAQDALFMQRVFERGATGCLVKPVSPTALEDSIRRIVRGEVVLAPEAARALVQSLKAAAVEGPPELAMLSPAEQKVLALAAAGFRNKEIGTVLGREDGTVHTLWHRAFEKLGVHNKKGALKKFIVPELSPSLKLFSKAIPSPAERLKTPKSLPELERCFHTEEACRQYLFQLRWPEGFSCPNCQGRRAWQTARGLWFCTVCHGQTSVTAGTIFQDTHVPLLLWFRALWELASQRKVPAASSLMQSLGLRSYKTAWCCLQKLKHCLDRVTNSANDRGRLHQGQMFRNLLEIVVQTPPQPFRELPARQQQALK